MGHGFHVEVHPAGGSVDCGNELTGFRTGGQEISLCWRGGDYTKSSFIYLVISSPASVQAVVKYPCSKIILINPWIYFL